MSRVFERGGEGKGEKVTRVSIHLLGARILAHKNNASDEGHGLSGALVASVPCQLPEPDVQLGQRRRQHSANEVVTRKEESPAEAA